jgi:hypothetical protein
MLKSDKAQDLPEHLINKPLAAKISTNSPINTEDSAIFIGVTTQDLSFLSFSYSNLTLF